MNCTGLAEIRLPNGIAVLSESLFEGCKSLTSVVIPNTVRKILDNCFYGSGLTIITIPESVEMIGSYAFARVSAKAAVLPKTVNSIGISVFAGIGDITVYDSADPDAKPASESDASGSNRKKVT